MEATVLVDFQQTTWRYIPDGRTLKKTSGFRFEQIVEDAEIGS
jgi:hypothetical protein